jgi:hypothetical protein
MSFDPERWLGVANVCCIPIPEVNREALLRTALTRAYYAALLSVKKRVEAVHGRGSVPSTGTHAALFQAVGTGGENFEEVYEVLSQLREARNKADYQLDTDPLVPDRVVWYVDRSRRLIRNRINAMRDEEYRALVVPRR